MDEAEVVEMVSILVKNARHHDLGHHHSVKTLALSLLASLLSFFLATLINLETAMPHAHLSSMQMPRSMSVQHRRLPSTRPADG